MLIANSGAILLTGWTGFPDIPPNRQTDSSAGGPRSSPLLRAITRRKFLSPRPRDETGGLARSIDILKRGAVADGGASWVKSNAAPSSPASCRARPRSPSSGNGSCPASCRCWAAVSQASTCSRGILSASRAIAAYGLAEGSGSAEAFAMCEGLVGQCAQERKVVTLTSLPPDYLRIASGLGSRLRQ